MIALAGPVAGQPTGSRRPRRPRRREGERVDLAYGALPRHPRGPAFPTEALAAP